MEAIFYLITWFLMKPVAPLHKGGFPAVAFQRSHLNSFIQKAKVISYDMQAIVFCIATQLGILSCCLLDQIISKVIKLNCMYTLDTN